MSIFSGCMVVFAILIKLVNIKYLLHITHRTKNLMVICSMVLGGICMVTAFAARIFVFTLFGCLFFGLGTSLGESTNLGFLKGFPNWVSGGYTSGTGLSGLIGTVFYFLLKLFHFSFYAVNLSIFIFYPIYAFVFYRVCVLKKRLENLPSTEDLFLSENLNDEECKDLTTIEEKEATVNEHLKLSNVKNFFPQAKAFFVWFFLLYLMEYMASSWFTSYIVAKYAAKYPKDRQPFFVNYGFELGAVFYRLSLFIGRSSLKFTKNYSLKSLIYLLMCFTCFYFIQTVSNIEFTFPVMFVTLSCIALIGGVSYCVIVFQVLSLQTVEKKDKENMMNFLSGFGELGMLVSSLLGIFFLKFLL